MRASARLAVLALGLSAGLGAGLGVSPAFACSCAQMSVEKTRAGAQVIVNGQVVAVDPAGNGRIRATIRVKQVIKGRVRAEVQIFTSQHPTMCGYTFRVGETGDFLANRFEGALSTNSCLMFNGRKQAR